MLYKVFHLVKNFPFLRNPKIHYRFQNTLLPVLILSQLNPSCGIILHNFSCTLTVFSCQRMDYPACFFPYGFPVNSLAYIYLIILSRNTTNECPQN